MYRVLLYNNGLFKEGLNASQDKNDSFMRSIDRNSSRVVRSLRGLEDKLTCAATAPFALKNDPNLTHSEKSTYEHAYLARLEEKTKIGKHYAMNTSRSIFAAVEIFETS